MKSICLLTMLFIAVINCSGQIRLPKLIGNGMVLQREDSVRIWGWATPDEKINLKFNNKAYKATTGKNGTWKITIPPQKAGGPYQMVLTASNRIVIDNILFGDVWLCGGQSNMEMPMERVSDKYTAVIAEAANTNIRQFLVPDKYDFEKPADDVDAGEWLPADAKNILQFSAVGYFFAREIYAKYRIPIGLINAAQGGSPAQAWISEDSIKKFPHYFNKIQKLKDNDLVAAMESQNRLKQETWYNNLNQKDEGLLLNWKSADLDDTDWKEMNIPGFWADNALGKLNGIIWFRKEITVPGEMTGRPAKLLMGRIVDADSIFINGRFAGTTSYQYPPRRYNLPADMLKKGKNVIAIKVINNYGKGGFIPGKEYSFEAGEQTIDLKGKWKYKTGAASEAAPPQVFVRWEPSGLYNGMIAPLHNFRIKGVLWYQGEANTGNPFEYGDLMKTLISDWRKRWNQGNFPFLYVQLPNYMETKDVPGESNWASLREVQLKLLSVPNTAMAVTIDLGEWNDIHPLNKQDVGKRLALLARRMAYHDRDVVYSGPLIKSLKADGHKLILHFSNIGGGLISKDSADLKYFSIAGADKKFIWARAKIQGDKVIVWSEEVPHPVFVRYAWADNPEGANLYNKELLPASPFEAKL